MGESLSNLKEGQKAKVLVEKPYCSDLKKGDIVTFVQYLPIFGKSIPIWADKDEHPWALDNDCNEGIVLELVD